MVCAGVAACVPRRVLGGLMRRACRSLLPWCGRVRASVLLLRPGRIGVALIGRIALRGWCGWCLTGRGCAAGGWKSRAGSVIGFLVQPLIEASTGEPNVVIISFPHLVKVLQEVLNDGRGMCVGVVGVKESR